MMSRAQFCTHLATLAQQGDRISDADFADACYRASSEHGFDPAYLTTHLEIAGSSFDRWMAGSNLPHVLVRGKILLAIGHALQIA